MKTKAKANALNIACVIASWVCYAGDLSVTLKNWNGNNSASDHTKLILYNNPQGPPLVTMFGNPVLFRNLAAGSYAVEGYQMGPFQEYEYWGAVIATVPTSGTAPAVINRHTPFVMDVWFEKDGRRLSQGEQVTPGDALILKLQIVNRLNWSPNAYASVGGRIGSSGNELGRWIFSSTSLPSNQTVVWSRPVQVADLGVSSGSLWVYVILRTAFASGYAITDSWDWTIC